jgi:hypothetical protein
MSEFDDSTDKCRTTGRQAYPCDRAQSTISSRRLSRALSASPQSSGLADKFVALGLARLFDKKATAPRRHIAPKATNVIPFPTDRSSNRRGWTGVKHDRRQ